jgi:hypothetical protein
MHQSHACVAAEAKRYQQELNTLWYVCALALDLRHTEDGLCRSTRWAATPPSGGIRTHACVSPFLPFLLHSKFSGSCRAAHVVLTDQGQSDGHGEKLRAALRVGGTLSLEALLVAEKHVFVDCISRAGFCRRKTRL